MLNSLPNSGRNSYGHSNSRMSNPIEPVDWLKVRRQKREEEHGGEFNYAHNEFWKHILPDNLSHENIDSYHDIKEKAKYLDKRAQKIESHIIDINASKNLISDVRKVGAMYVDSIRAKAALIDKL